MSIATPTGLQLLKYSKTPIPINDLGPQCTYSKAEKTARLKLAALYRLVDIFQWSLGIFSHITYELDETSENGRHFLINPFGLLYNEISAGSLIKIDSEGTIIDRGNTNLGINRVAFVLHSLIHRRRPDAKCIIHLHMPVVAAISALKCGLMSTCQEAIIINDIAYHDYNGILTDDAERDAIADNLGNRKIMILRNHGFVACGSSVEEVFNLAYNLIIACDTQARVSAVNIDDLVLPEKHICARTYAFANKTDNGDSKAVNNEMDDEIAALEWEAWMRMLDAADFRTGHTYLHPELKQRYPSAALNGTLH